MILSPWRIVVAVLVVPLALSTTPAAAQAGITFTEEQYPGSMHGPEPAWIVARVVDDLTGAPIGGADVYLVEESATPLAAEFWFTRKVQTDAGGWLRAPVGDIQGRYHMQVLRHPDYGVATRYGNGDEIWRIGRPFDVPVLVRDWQGKPAVGALIGFCGGCGHTPDLQNAVTDARGVAVLPRVDPQNDVKDIYVQHPGASLGHDSLRWYPGDPPAIVDCRWSPALTGTVLDHLGKPLAGVFVSSHEVHRGPWAKTAADGSFTLLGGKPAAAAAVVREPHGREVWFPTAKRYPVTLHMSDPSGDDPHEGTITEPPGNTIVVDPRTIRIRLEGAKGLIARADYPGAAERRPKSTEQLVVPSAGPFVLELWIEDGPRGRPYQRSFAYDDASQLPPEPVVLTWFEPTRLVGQVVDAAGKPVAARVRLRERWSKATDGEFLSTGNGTFSLSTLGTGLTLVEVVALDEQLLPRMVWVTLPMRGGKRGVDLGQITVRRQPQLRVLDEAGDALANATVHFARAGLQEPGDSRKFPLRADGAWLGPDLRAGDAIVVRIDEDAVPFRTVLTADGLDDDGPCTIRAPGGQLRLQVFDDRGKPLEATCVLGDHYFEVRNNQMLRGLPRGPLRCFVSALDHQSAIVDTVIGNEPNELRVTLPRRRGARRR